MIFKTNKVLKKISLVSKRAGYNSRSLWLFFMAVMSILLLQNAKAGLYPAAAPPNSAYVRVFNGVAGNPVSAKVGEQSISSVPSYDVSTFIFMPPGNYAVTVGSASQQLSAQANRYYTIALQGGTLQVFDQGGFSSQLKAMVAVFNLTDAGPLALKTADGKTPVIENIAAHSSGQRELNAVTANFAIFKSDAKLADAKPVTLERGGVSSLFVTGTVEQPLLIWTTK